MMFVATWFLDRPIRDRPKLHRQKAGALVVRRLARGPEDTLAWLPIASRFDSVYSTYFVRVIDRRVRRLRSNRRTSLLRSLQHLIQRCDVIDLYFLTDNGENWIDFLERYAPREVLHSKLRLVYDSRHGCERCAADWREIGAKLFVAHPYLEEGSRPRFLPQFHVPFLRRWLSGFSLGEAVADANRRVHLFGGHDFDGDVWTGYEWGSDFCLTRSAR